jgi:uncharacterized protein YcaQ
VKKIIITKQQARSFMLSYQGIGPPFEFQGKSGILEYIRRVNCIQFDPLNIAGHNQELVLQARIEGFQPHMLQELLYRERKLIDGWDKNMCIYCTEDWPYFRRSREEARERLGNRHRPTAAILEKVRRQFEEQGPLTSADLDYDQTVDWPWAPTRLSRAVLESMYFWGELIIHHKIHTRKVYDLASRHIPRGFLEAVEPNETEEQYHDWYVLRRIGSVGLLWNKSGDAWLGIAGMKTRERSESLSRLFKRNQAIEVSVEGIKLPFYTRSEDQPRLDVILKGEKAAIKGAILAPLDNLLWDRQLIKELFGFEYKWEVYKPVTERNYGYYVLPVLYGDRFVARFEPGRDKKNNALVIKNWWWEPEVERNAGMNEDLRDCFQRFKSYLSVESIRIDEPALKQAGLDWLNI